MLDNATNVAEAASAASTAAGSPLLEIAKTWIAYIGVLATAIIVAFGGIRKALKDLKGDAKSPTLMNPGGPAAGPDVQRIVGGTIMETTTLLLWSESNKQVVEAAEDVLACIKTNTEAVECLPDQIKDALSSLVNAINYSNETGRAIDKGLGELRHEVVRLRDSMERMR